jgi:hypothetical protein
MQVSILEGIYASDSANFQTSYPINMAPVITESGISEGYLRTWPGVDTLAVGPGPDRGAYLWLAPFSSFSYRVMGSKLCQIAGPFITPVGDVGTNGKPVSFDNSFNKLAIASNGDLFYWDGALTQVTDPDLGTVLDVIFIDGYFMTTDGTFLVVTELNDPYSVNPLKYGTADANPDAIVALRRVRDEVYAVGRFTIENFQNIGGNGFPFQRNPGGLIPKGAIGTHAVSYFLDTFAFVGGGENEAPSVWIAGYGQALPISTPQIDREIQAVPHDNWGDIEVEAIQEKGEQRLLIHLPVVNKTLVYYHQATKTNGGKPVWSILRGGVNLDQAYPARHFVYAEDRWQCGSQASEMGFLNEAIETQFGDTAGWQFDTKFLYNQGRGAILKSAELVGLPGRVPDASNPTAFMSWTQDGQTWSQERAISTGSAGQRLKRMQWRPKTKFANYMGLRFRGANTALQGIARLEVDPEPLNA